MGESVKVRDGYTISDDGLIHYAERAITWPEADEMAGRRLDRRKAWAFIDGELCDCVSWTAACSGCSDEVGAARGGGCSECGYHGVSRQAMWVPATFARATPHREGE
ncbi:hypothetical protein HOY34_13780 [Xinfangfangia sp. D13-10-4-6]|uniref:hypothetical protein n=1 Tax=Pseudogemmobacter hezensis TaxID=2737662 RepID=UPI0015524A74|nr:hypothetical protein [Pseudogemmobacter hezensis]NPD16265.1 hypothetical protein [Pseudogemmobacter hezensis]